MPDLSKQDKQKILKDAKRLRSNLVKEAQKYERAKVKGRTKDFYNRAAKLVREEAKQYTQKSVQASLKKDDASAQELKNKLDLEKSFGRGITATNVARRILTTRSGNETSQAGARFYGGLVSIWNVGETETQRSKAYSMRDKLIMRSFGKKNLLEVMELIEAELNINLIDMLQDPAKYDEAVNAIQSYVAEKIEK